MRMSASGYKQTFRGLHNYVRLAPNRGRKGVWCGMSAYDPPRTLRVLVTQVQRVREIRPRWLISLPGRAPAFHFYPNFVELWRALGVTWKSIIYLAPTHLGRGVNLELRFDRVRVIQAAQLELY